jgi:hypothetical protein
MNFDTTTVRKCLKSFDFKTIFREHLGWNNHKETLDIKIGDSSISLTAFAEKRGFVAWMCPSIPERSIRLKIDNQVTKSSREHFVVFADQVNGQQVWQWVRREQGKPLAVREQRFDISQAGEALIQRLEQIAVSIEEEEALTVVDVAGRARAAFDVEKVTKKFYEQFDKQRQAFVKFIQGIGDVADRDWYASVMLNRLMFVYFIQRKGFLDGDTQYLRNRLARCKSENGKDKFYSFYRLFLLHLFHAGFGMPRKNRSPKLEKLLGNIPYLNGGLFDVHELEKPERYGKDIQISDEAFEKVFEYFDQYEWHLDERSLKNDKEINPDVLGYIFEKYINQKQMGAYYTKEDITEYISKSTIIPFLFDQTKAHCGIAFENATGRTIWDLLRDDPDKYIYPAVLHGTEKKLPPEIAAGLDALKPNLIERRKPWNKPAPTDYALPTEIWREVITRRLRCEEIKCKLAAGEVRAINDFITLNLDLRQFAQDVIQCCEGPELLRAFWTAIQKITVLDPTCGSGAFLFAAANILEPLYEACLDRMEAFVADDDKSRIKPPDEVVRELIGLGESQTLEFKATARWNIKESKGDKVMEQVIIKTVAALLNSDGGSLLIGVQDNGSIFGIEVDLQLFSTDKRNRDAYENWLMTQLLGAYGKQHAANLRISFVRLEEKDVCRVTVSPASSAVYAQDKLYVRSGNSIRELITSEAVAYHEQRFKNFTPPPKAVEPSNSSSPKKFTDFREVIAKVSAHPKRSYFIFKSIILNNLFGVDIMEEAVEICKLRLFLKLAAQVEPDAARDNLGIEPLPDIDFNIRAGNTLVGYATYDEVKRAITSGLDFENAMEKISIKAADLQQTFDKFRQLQTEGDGSVPAAHKLELQKRLKALEDELNSHLAGEYGVKVSDKAAYAQWVKSHQPFHWFVEFYGIVSNGGFDVVIGNPPYVEYGTKLQSQYRVKNYATLSCGNLHAFCAERSLVLTSRAGRTGLIVPLPSINTDRMAPLQSIVKPQKGAKGRSLWVSSFDERPSNLFSGVDQRLVIEIFGAELPQPVIATTGINRWASKIRDNLFPNIFYSVQDPQSASRTRTILKVKNVAIEASLLTKLYSNDPIDRFRSSLPTKDLVAYRTAGGRYWKVVLDTPFDLDAVSGKVSYLKGLSGRQAVALISSSTFWWYYSCHFDMYNLKDYMIFGFRFANPTSHILAELGTLGGKLVKSLETNAEVQTMHSQTRGSVEQKIYNAGKSKPILDEIDTVLAGHYGFTAEELDFILNYDIKYRLGRSTETDEE